MIKKNLNKAVTDSISAALENGINVNIRIETATYVMLFFVITLATAVIMAANYGLHILKNK
jgi:hypothetical protein